MHKMKKIAALVAASCAFVAADASAWGYQGHRVVGAIADQLLKGSKAELRLKSLLLPGETLESISVWADNAKGSYNGSVVTQEMTDYTNAHPKHQEYHYTDIPFQNAKYTDGAVGAFEHDIVQTMKQAIAVLQGKTDPANNPRGFTPRQALLVLTHLAGDITQPLHVGAPYLNQAGQFAVPDRADQYAIPDTPAAATAPFVDLRGGNDLVIEDKSPLAPGAEKRNPRALHSYWDSAVVEYAMKRVSTKTPAEFAQAIITGKPPVAPTQGEVTSWPYQWANDTLQVSKAAYVGLQPGARTSITSRDGKAQTKWLVNVPDNYAEPSSAIASEQLVKGGYRLAQLLQAVLN
ncbi:MAG TPA: S1/P1 nuclease [Burkholderiaceae bacterium]